MEKSKKKTKKVIWDIWFFNLISKKLIDVPMMGCILLFIHSWENSKTPNILLLSVIAIAGILFFFANLIISFILRALSESEYEDRVLKCIKGKFISLELNSNF